MKSIFRTIVALAMLLMTFSCSKMMAGLYITIPNTTWSYTLDDQRALVHFMSNDRVTIVQRNNSNGAVQFNNGTYSVDGHAVDILSDEGASNRLVRTFSNLKNSQNKNFSTFKPQEYASMDYTVWTSLRQDVFRIAYFTPYGIIKQASFKNVIHEEGVPYGWEGWETNYTLTGSHLDMGKESATLFEEVMLVDDVWFMHFPVNENKGNSDLTGTMWTYRSSGYPGIIVFDTNSSFTRILLSSRILYQVTRGNYVQNGNIVSFSFDGKSEDCLIEDGSFTLMERTYDLYQ
ncbi:MAG: hypothetical protein J6P56_06205 [Bacteroidales bacterium]|nr:hypothetical protein [Bacteroidales bacterium]